MNIKYKDSRRQGEGKGERRRQNFIQFHSEESEVV
jgi:hypothetical protein